jgi:fatty-acyl-CoA synthase
MHVVDLFDLGARNHPGRAMATGAGGEWTYAETQAATNRIARQLLAEGFGIGTPFAVLSPNCGQALVAMLGGLRAGCAWCNVNLRAAVATSVETLRRGRCQVLLFHSSVARDVPAFEQAIPELRRVLCIDSDESDHPSIESWSAGQSPARLEHPIPEDAPGVQGATGGTTGEPKIAQATNAFMSMSVLAWQTCWSFDHPPVNLAIAPITHAAGLVALGHLPFGGTNVMMDAPDLDRAVELIESRRVTTLFLPPTLIYLLLAHPRLDDADTSWLRYLISAAAPIAPEKLVEVMQRLGPVACQAYGQTEAGFPLTWISPHEAGARGRGRALGPPAGLLRTPDTRRHRAGGDHRGGRHPAARRDRRTRRPWADGDARLPRRPRGHR